MFQNPNSLYNILLEFVATNVALIDSLEDFPSLIGESIFRKVVLRQQFLSSDRQLQTKIAALFVVAYKDLLLSSLALPDSLVMINEFLDPLLKFSECISELDLSFCFLGDNHEIIECICNMNSLKKLSLKSNCLTDNAVRKLTLPVHMFNKGPTDLHFLDLSGNKALTDKIAPWISRLKYLLILDLTGTMLTDKGITHLEVKSRLYLSNECECPSKPIKTVGWATEIIEQWMEFCDQRKKSRKMKIIKKTGFFSLKKKVKEINMEKSLTADEVTLAAKQKHLIFRKAVYTDIINHSPFSKDVETCKTVGESVDYFKAMEKELFLEYQ